jgi:hypothetical protein
MRKPPNKWPRTDTAEQVLFFAQLLREMISDDTYESFRVPSLGTIAKIRETKSVALDVSEGRVKATVLEPFRKELIKTLEIDPVVNILLGEKSLSSIKRMASSGDSVGIYEYLDYYDRKKIDGYYEELSYLILENIELCGCKSKLRLLCRLILSHILNCGYSRKKIRDDIYDIFFSLDVYRIDLRKIRKFLNIYTFTPIKYKVYCIIGTDYVRFLKESGFKVLSDINELPKYVLIDTKKVSSGNKSPKILEIDILAYDSFDAAYRAFYILDSTQALGALVPHKFDFRWEDRCVVVPFGSNKAVIREQDTLPLHRKTVANNTKRRAESSIRSYTKKIFSNFDDGSSEKILQSLRVSNLAHKSFSIESQLVDLWSAVEVLYGDPKSSESRIKHYTSMMLPAICLRYARRQAVALHSALVINYRTKLNKIIIRETVFNNKMDHHTRFAAILLMDENNFLQKELLDMCEDNPLARHRLAKFQKDFRTPKSALKTICAHMERVEWQINRIYRERNLLVHKGIRSPNAESLVINLNEYYMSCIGSMVSQANKEQMATRIDRISKDIRVEFDEYLMGLEKSKHQDRLEKEDVMSLLSR